MVHSACGSSAFLVAVVMLWPCGPSSPSVPPFLSRCLTEHCPFIVELCRLWVHPSTGAAVSEALAEQPGGSSSWEESILCWI